MAYILQNQCSLYNFSIKTILIKKVEKIVFWSIYNTSYICYLKTLVPMPNSMIYLNCLHHDIGILEPMRYDRATKTISIANMPNAFCQKFEAPSKKFLLSRTMLNRQGIDAQLTDTSK